MADPEDWGEMAEAARAGLAEASDSRAVEELVFLAAVVTPAEAPAIRAEAAVIRGVIPAATRAADLREAPVTPEEVEDGDLTQGTASADSMALCVGNQRFPCKRHCASARKAKNRIPNLPSITL
jgi:hypothetical protein